MVFSKLFRRWDSVNVLTFFYSLILFLMPFEHKYDKPVKKLSKFFNNSHPELEHVFRKPIYFYATEILIVLLAVFIFIKYRPTIKKFFFQGPVKFLSLYFIISVLSLINVNTGNFGLQFFSVFRLLTMLLLVCGIYYLFANNSIKDLTQKIFFIILMISLFECFVAISQYFLQSSLGLKLIGEINLNPNENPNLTSFQNSGGNRWFFDNFFSINRESTIIIRPTGTFPHTNILGGFMAFSTMIGFYFFLKNDKKWHKAVAAIIIIIQFFTLFITYSRSAILSVAISLFVGFILFVFMEKDFFKSFKKLGGVILLFILVITFNFIILYKPLKARGGFFSYSASASGSIYIRKVHHNYALKMIKKNPVLGVGLDNYDVKLSSYIPEGFKTYGGPGYCHNIYFLIAAETGILGILCFGLFLSNIIFSSLYRKKLTLENIILFSILIGLLFLGCCDFYILKFQQGKLMLFFSLSLLACFSKISKLSKASDPNLLEADKELSC